MDENEFVDRILSGSEDDTVDKLIGSNETVRHNHFTRDVKPKGKCPACDRYHESKKGER